MQLLKKKNIQDYSFDDAYKLVSAASNEYKELILICEGCYKFFLRTFIIEVFFEETKICLIEIGSKNFLKIELKIMLL